jgi:hypothetical protein
MRLVPYRPFHMHMLQAQGVQAAQVSELSIVPGQYASVIGSAGAAFTVWKGESIVACAGMVSLLPHCGTLWAVLAQDAGRSMLWIHRAVTRFLEMQTVQRLEATVLEGFDPGCRWLELLGFTYEGRMRAYGPDGSTHLRYARVRL